MSEEIKIITLGDIFKNIETEEKAFKFKDYIKHLQQKVEQQEKEIDRLNNIINELEKWLEERTYGMNEIHTYKIGALEDEVILNKLKALKENNK